MENPFLYFFALKVSFCVQTSVFINRHHHRRHHHDHHHRRDHHHRPSRHHGHHHRQLAVLRQLRQVRLTQTAFIGMVVETRQLPSRLQEQRQM